MSYRCFFFARQTSDLMGDIMKNITELRNALAKVIVSYRNIKFPKNLQHLDIDSYVKSPDSIVAVKACMNETIQIESSKKEHLALFYDLFLFLDTLCKKYIPKAEEKRIFLRDELILVLQEIDLLNHDGYSHKVSIGGKPYNLTTTVKNFGYGPGITELGHIIREFILVPLGASRDSVPSTISREAAKKNIQKKTSDFFVDFIEQEKKQLDNKLLEKKMATHETQILKLEGLLQPKIKSHAVPVNLAPVSKPSYNSFTFGLGFFNDAKDDEPTDPSQKSNASSCFS